MIQLYHIVWKHKNKGTTGKSNRLYSAEEVKQECEVLNNKHRDIEHKAEVCSGLH